MSAGVLVLLTLSVRPLRTSCWMVGTGWYLFRSGSCVTPWSDAGLGARLPGRNAPGGARRSDRRWCPRPCIKGRAEACGGCSVARTQRTRLVVRRGAGQNRPMPLLAETSTSRVPRREGKRRIAEPEATHGVQIHRKSRVIGRSARTGSSEGRGWMSAVARRRALALPIRSSHEDRDSEQGQDQRRG